jgi:hypothetical protein
VSKLIPYTTDYDYEKDFRLSQDPPSDELALYEDFLRRELPPFVRLELEERIDRALEPVEELYN